MSLIDLASMVLAPTAVKDGKVYNAIPNDQDFTFSRGTESTRINSAGLIEKARTNFLLQSNQFDTTWFNVNANVTGGQSGYDGSSDAWELELSNSGGSARQNIAFSGVVTFSVYLKAGTLNYARILLLASPNNIVDINLTNGNTASGTGIDATSTNIGNGWYKYCFTANITSGTRVYIYPTQAIGDFTATSGNIYIQDAQLEQGLVATDYIETTTSSVTVGITDDLPRVDYSGGGCPSLLLEPSRTQLLPHSEYFGAWSLARTTLTNNDTTSPEGVNNATKVTQSASSTNGGAVYYTIALTSTEYSYSVFAKAGTASFINIAENASTASAQRTWFNLSTGAIGTTSSEHTATIEDYGNGWYRCSITFTARTSGSYAVLNYLSDADNSTTAVLSSTAYICGAMLEAGSYVSSYIPTYGTSTSRSADSCSLTNASNLIGQTEGTLFMDFVLDSVDGGNDFRFDITEGTSFDNEIFVGMTNGDLRALIRVSASTVYDSGNISATVGTRYKMALAYANNDVAFYVNGTQESTSSSATIPNTDEITIGNRTDSKAMVVKESLNQAILFPTRLTNDQLQELTK